MAETAVSSTNILMVGSFGLRILMMEIEGALFGFLLLRTAERVPGLFHLCSLRTSRCSPRGLPGRLEGEARRQEGYEGC